MYQITAVVVVEAEMERDGFAVELDHREQQPATLVQAVRQQRVELALLRALEQARLAGGAPALHVLLEEPRQQRLDLPDRGEVAERTLPLRENQCSGRRMLALPMSRQAAGASGPSMSVGQVNCASSTKYNPAPRPAA